MNILKLPPFFLALLATFAGCEQPLRISTPKRSRDALSGSAYYKKVGAMKWNEREPIALKEILGGDIPQFLKTFVPIRVSIRDSTGQTIHCTYFVAPDYLSIGSNRDFARVPLTPMAAQQIADSFHCFLPTRKMVNDIYAQAKVKLEPVPLYAFRDSALIFWHHHLIIEGQRKGRKGLIAGIKKDLVISEKLTRAPKPDREAIYGWHKPDGTPIQPLYVGHVNWWVDYSHGIRLIYRKVKINGHWMDYIDVMKNPAYRALLCDEEFCDCYRYDFRSDQ
jgi:hypothetical protein